MYFCPPASSFCPSPSPLHGLSFVFATHKMKLQCLPRQRCHPREAEPTDQSPQTTTGVSPVPTNIGHKYFSSGFCRKRRAYDSAVRINDNRSMPGIGFEDRNAVFHGPEYVMWQVPDSHFGGFIRGYSKEERLLPRHLAHPLREIYFPGSDGPQVADQCLASFPQENSIRGENHGFIRLFFGIMVTDHQESIHLPGKILKHLHPFMLGIEGQHPLIPDHQAGAAFHRFARDIQQLLQVFLEFDPLPGHLHCLPIDLGMMLIIPRLDDGYAHCRRELFK